MVLFISVIHGKSGHLVILMSFSILIFSFQMNQENEIRVK